MTPRKEERDADGRRTAAEWTLFGICAAVVLAIVGVLAADSINGGSDPPAFRTRMLPVVQAEGGYQLPVEIENTGGQAAAELVVAVELDLGDGDPVEAENTIDFLSGGERTEVTFAFDDDPREGAVRVRIAGYLEP